MPTLRILGTARVLSFSAEVAQSARASEPEPVVTPLMRKDLGDVPGREMLMIAVDYPPGTVEHIHRHDSYALLYLLEALMVKGGTGGKELTLTRRGSAEEGRRPRGFAC